MIRTHVRMIRKGILYRRSDLVVKGVESVTVQMVGAVTLDDIDLIVDALLEQVEHLSGADASAQLARVSAFAAKLSAYRVALVSKIQTSQVWRESDPNATAASFLRQEHAVDHREAKADLRAAESFGRFPDLQRACRAGKLSREKMDLIVSVGLRTAEREAVFGDFVSLFVDIAPRLTLSQLRRTMEVWADQVDPVTTCGDDHDAHRRRELHLHAKAGEFAVPGRSTFLARDRSRSKPRPSRPPH